MQLDDPISTIKGIGEKTEKLFQKLNVDTVGSLLSFYPRKYDCFKDPVLISELKENDTGVICGLVSNVVEPKYKARVKVTTCRVSDSSGSVELVWFNQPYIKYELKSGYHFIFRGKVTRKGRYLQMEQAKVYVREDYLTLKNVLQPVYPLTAGLSNKLVTKSVKQALLSAEDLPEFLPSSVRKEYDVMKKKYAVSEMHFPKSNETMMMARSSLVFEEFFLFRLYIKAMSFGKEVRKSNLSIIDDGSCDELIKMLPFTLTEDQKNVFSDIKNDMTSGKVMARLVMGDVGSGKTIVAELALLLVAKSGYQGALMAPTEVLARQHYESIGKHFSKFGIRCSLLVGSLTAAEKRKVHLDICNKNTDIIIGTHALFQEKVEFNSLALCVTDEQHRFGVRQRESLGDKGITPHILVMSATPIPRTLAMMLYGDMDISKINTVPAERLPIKNCVVGQDYREKAYNFIKERVSLGDQVYVICPMIDSNEGSDLQNVTDYSEMLNERFEGKIKVGTLHGKMKPEKKNKVMEEFEKGGIDVLVSTTVVEVGVNVPNATVMIIEDAERFGLAQLHQLRGRVGRGNKQSYCIFIHGEASEQSVERLNTLLHSNDGFHIASEDLRLRGPGDMFGVRQCGELLFKLGDIYNDAEIMTKATDAADSLEPKEINNILKKMSDSGAKEVFQFFDNYVTI